jgi:hypothetical protein
LFASVATHVFLAGVVAWGASRPSVAHSFVVDPVHEPGTRGEERAPIAPHDERCTAGVETVVDVDPHPSDADYAVTVTACDPAKQDHRLSRR